MMLQVYCGDCDGFVAFQIEDRQPRLDEPTHRSYICAECRRLLAVFLIAPEQIAHA